MKTLFHIRPIYLDFIWAGKKLIEKFKLQTELKSVGTIYLVVALPGHLDNIVEESAEPLSVFYKRNRKLFGIKEELFPVRMTITCNEGIQSYQVHPNDEYALANEGTKGKVSGGIILEGNNQIRRKLFGHRLNSLEEFKEALMKKDWESLFNTIEIKDGQFIHTPAGVPHGGKGDGEITVTYSSNSDITYRFYDFERNDPNRPLSLNKVYDCLNFPEVPLGAITSVPIHQKGIDIYKYHDTPREYTAGRLVVKDCGLYKTQGFMFYGCYQGQGTLNGVFIKAGETLFSPIQMEQIEIEGPLDLVTLSYRSLNME